MAVWHVTLLDIKEDIDYLRHFLVDSEMEKFILTNPPVSSIRDLAIKKGMVTMYQSGLIDIVLGKTTFEEVARVVEEDEEQLTQETPIDQKSV